MMMILGFLWQVQQNLGFPETDMPPGGN